MCTRRAYEGHEIATVVGRCSASFANIRHADLTRRHDLGRPDKQLPVVALADARL